MDKLDQKGEENALRRMLNAAPKPRGPLANRPSSDQKADERAD
jgi:hypothetical protein